MIKPEYVGWWVPGSNATWEGTLYMHPDGLYRQFMQSGRYNDLGPTDDFLIAGAIESGRIVRPYPADILVPEGL